MVRSSLVHLVDPLAGQIGESGEVRRTGQPLGLEAAHLAGRGSSPFDRPVADHPTHCRVAAQSVGVIHVLVAGEPSKYRLPQQTDQQVAPVSASACLRQSLAAACGQCENVVQFAVGQNPPSEVITEPWNRSITRRSKSSVSAPLSASPAGSAMPCPVRSSTTYCILYDIQDHCAAKYGTIRGMRAYACFVTSGQKEERKPIVADLPISKNGCASNAPGCRATPRPPRRPIHADALAGLHPLPRRRPRLPDQ
jgi:hypothetical protein